MNKDEIIADLNKIIATLKGEEKKEERKLWEILSENAGKGSKGEAKAAIDAVIECYEEWMKTNYAKYFPEYLKEKLGNE